MKTEKSMAFPITVLEHEINERRRWIKFYRKGLRRKTLPFCHSKREVKAKQKRFRSDIVQSRQRIIDLKAAIKILSKPVLNKK